MGLSAVCDNFPSYTLFLVEAIVTVLQQFKWATEMLSAEKTPNTSLDFGSYDELDTALSENGEESSTIKNEKCNAHILRIKNPGQRHRSCGIFS